MLVPTGSTGEAYALSDAERLQVIETVIDCAGGNAGRGPLTSRRAIYRQTAVCPRLPVDELPKSLDKRFRSRMPFGNMNGLPKARKEEPLREFREIQCRHSHCAWCGGDHSGVNGRLLLRTGDSSVEAGR